jgi:hypothetical protein
VQTIALLTDFGYSDPYVGIMKGVISTTDPDVRCIDLTHAVRRHSILSASYILYSAWDWLPEETVFLSVVDPGVGSARRELIGMQGNKLVVTPDNGTVSLLVRMSPDLACYRADPVLLGHLRQKKPAYNNTFDGRDLFAPIAARAAAAESVQDVIGNLTGEEITPILRHEVGYDGEKKQGTIMHIDHFGNCISSVHITDIGEPASGTSGDISVSAGSGKFPELYLSESYSDVAPGEPLVYWGSAGFLELAVREGSAEEEYTLSIGDVVEISLL